MIHKRRNAGPAPASYAQQGLWFFQAAEPDSGAYHNVFVWRLGGHLDRMAMGETLRTIVRRHQTLRTRFRSSEGGLLQVIASENEFELRHADLRGQPWGRRRFRVAELVRDMALRPFELAAELPIRATLIRTAPRKHVLALVLHHIACDGWSIGIFVRELSIIYGAIRQGRLPLLAPLPIEYADFAAWERQRVASGAMAANLAFWEQRLTAQEAIAQIQPDRLPEPDSCRGSTHVFRIGPAVVSRLRAIGTAQNATLFMVLLTGIEALLHRYTGLDDISVGTAVANRMLPETHDVIGYFANTVVLRCDAAGDPSFRELLGRVQQTLLDALDRQDMPFSFLVERLKQGHNHDRAPFFRIMVVHQSGRLAAPILSGVSVSQVPFHNGSAKFDLTITLTEAEGGIRGLVEYRSDLCHARSIQRFFRQYAC